jgi:tripartite-type tricarboxylate transporter receptor subunit TctC
VIVPVAAGGANDTTARLFAQKLTEILGQQC